MNLIRKSFAFLLFSCIFCSQLSAQTITAIKTDNWSKTNTWDLNRIPMPGDTVVINSYVVTVDVDATVAEIQVSNAEGKDGYLYMNTGGVTLTVTGDVLLTATDFKEDVVLELTSSDSMYVGGDVIFTRLTDASASKVGRIELAGNSKLTIAGNLTYDYQNGANNEDFDEIEVINDAELRVMGDVNINQSDGGNWSFYANQNGKVIFENNVNVDLVGGKSFYFNLKGSSTVEVNGDFSLENANTKNPNSDATILVGNDGGCLKIDGDLNLTSSIDNHTAFLEIEGGTASASIRGNINFTGSAEGNVGAEVKKGATILLGGSLNRMSPEKYGLIEMESDTKFVYDGNTSQTIACSDMPGNGTDVFNFSQVEFKNTSGLPMTLEGDLLVEKELMLETGIIETTASAMLIVGSDATVSGGSELAFVDGPMRKEGTTSAAGFTFPIGDMGVFAPLSISQVNSSTAEYTAKYLSCPPPLSGSLDVTSLVSVSGTGHWEFSGTATSPDVNVSLHWEDADAYGITDLDDLVVARWDTGMSHWKSIGKSSTLDNGDGSGSIVNDLSCPPPLSGSLLTFGSKNGINPLPVVMSAFTARANGKIVTVSWETVSEENSDYFVIERSNNGLNFKEINKIDAYGNTDQLTRYAVRDINPEKGGNYYRLCQVDLSGMKVYSRVLLVNFEFDSEYLVFPNPVKDILQVRGDFEAKVYELEFFDTSGKLLGQRSVMAESGFMSFAVNQLNLPKPGLYFMRVNYEKRQETIPFIKD